MPQLPNRDDAEKRLAAVIQHVQLRTREKLVRALGSPPDARRIPESLWQEVERELSRETEALLVLFLIAAGGTFTSWLANHPEHPAHRDALYQPERFADIAARVGRAQAARMAQQMTATSKRRLSEISDKLGRVTTLGEELRRELESAGRMTPEVREQIKERVSADRRATAVELYDRAVESITSESRAEIAARTEVTQSTTLGEVVVERRWRERTPQLVTVKYWTHRTPSQPGHPCPEICQPLRDTPQQMWPAIHPDLPEVWDGPPGHPNCDCSLTYSLLTHAQAMRMPMTFPRAGKAASLVSELLAASGQYLPTSLPRHWPGAAFKTSSCGANAPGGGGFQPGNTCAAGDDARPIDTPEFRRWFGDSKIVDQNGNPLVVYHGTRGQFSVFNPAGSEYGIYLTTRKRYAERYAQGGTVMELYASIRNPLIVEGKYEISPRNISADDIQELESQGYDGIVVVNYRDAENRAEPDPIHRAVEIVAFRPEQIKSVDNDGTFDPSNPDIRKTRRRA